MLLMIEDGLDGLKSRSPRAIQSFLLRENDRLLLCINGLTVLVSDRYIAQILRKNPDCRSACKALVAQANKAGSTDNITTIIIDSVNH